MGVILAKDRVGECDVRKRSGGSVLVVRVALGEIARLCSRELARMTERA